MLETGLMKRKTGPSLPLFFTSYHQVFWSLGMIHVLVPMFVEKTIFNFGKLLSVSVSSYLAGTFCTSLLAKVCGG